MVLLTGHVILWAKLRKPRFAGGREFGTAVEIENENDSWFLGLAIADGQFKTPGDNVERQLAVGEDWVKRNGQWLIRGYSGTLIE